MTFPTLPLAVKICCIASPDEAQRAVAAGATAIGLVSAMPSGPGVISEERIAQIAREVAPPTQSFLLTALRDARAIAVQHRRCRTTTLQLVDHVPHDELRALREALPGIQLVQVIHVTGEASVDEALAVAPLVDALLLDSGNPALAVKELGGTGRTHDWQLSRRIREAVALPVYLAGGLNASNVAQAVAQVRPFGLDLCSGVRSGGQLDDAKLSGFFAALRAGDAMGPAH
jgi:phosphoribosylanthranilate isomerase